MEFLKSNTFRVVYRNVLTIYIFVQLIFDFLLPLFFINTSELIYLSVVRYRDYIIY